MFDLSICIPTYNRANLLKEAIESVLSQLDDNSFSKVEIAISDNCSTDNTSEIIDLLTKQYPMANITFSISERNQGPDRNYLRSVDISSGKYCWFLGSDDKVAEGAVERVLNEINNNHTIYLSDRYSADFQKMEIFGIHRFFSDDLESDHVFYFSNDQDWDFYLNRCQALGSLFSYLSSIVFLKSEWDSVSKDIYMPFIGTAYVHVAVLLEMLKGNRKSTLKYLCNPIVINRTGNDSFFESMYKRTMLDINGYLMLSDLFVDNVYAKKGIQRLIKKEHPTVNYRLYLTTSNVEFSDLINKMRIIGYSDLEIDHFTTLRKFKILSLIIFWLNGVFKRLSKGKIWK